MEARLKLSTPRYSFSALRTLSPVLALVAGGAVTLVLIAIALFTPDGDAVLWANAHWSVSFTTAFVVAALTARRAPEAQRPVRNMIALGLGLYALGQLAYVIQIAVGYLAPFGPADLLFLATGLPLIVAFRRSLHGRIPASEELSLLLDAAMVFCGITTLIVAAFGLPSGGPALATGLAQLGYAMVFMAAAGGGLIVALATRTRPAGLFMLFGLGLGGTAWMGWIQQAQGSPAPAGSPVEILFSVSALLIAVGAIHWSPMVSVSPTYQRLASVLGDALPVAAVLGAFALSLVDLGERTTLVTGAVLMSIAVALVRQWIRIRERGVLLSRERDASIRLEEAEAQYRTLVERIPAAVYLDRLSLSSGEFLEAVYVSPKVERLTGFHPDEFRSDADLWIRQVHPEDRDRIATQDMKAYTGGEPLDQEYRFVRKDGRVIWLHEEASVLPSRETDTILSHGFIVDVTERKTLEEQLAHQAFHDSLTGLANRALFGDRLDHALARRRRSHRDLAVLFLDLDGFKTVNDSLGHATGDELLQAVASRLHGALRATDTVARLGGDEFAVLLEEVDGPAEAEVAAARILDAVHAPIAIAGRSVVCRASMGIAVAGDNDSASTLLGNADAAMYQAKAVRRGGAVVFQPGMHAAALIRFELEGELRQALERGELWVAYQPTVDLIDRRIVGVEALARWDHPTRGSIPPATFIDIAEETGLIFDLGRWVLREACLQGAAWRRRGPTSPEFTVSVNVSARQLAPELVVDVVAILAETGFEARELVLEVTESSVMQDTARAVEVLSALRAIGVRVAVDDFGTGYSSLGSLRSLPIDVLKIDRSFVVGAVSATEAPLTETLVRLGNVLGFTTIAEGVETEDQARALLGLGCRYGQGYLFGRPMRAEAFARIMQAPAAIGAALPPQPLEPAQLTTAPLRVGNRRLRPKGIRENLLHGLHR